MLVRQPWRSAAEWHRSGTWQETTLADLLNAAADARPDDTAYVDGVDGARTTTWSGLRSAAARLGGDLRARGCGPGDVVVLVLADGPEMIAAMTAVQAVGAVAAPLPSSAGVAEVDDVVTRTSAQVVLVDQPLDLSAAAQVVRLGALESWDGSDAGLPAAAASPAADEVADLMFTSGTTGPPKGVMNSANTKLAGLRGFLAEHPITPSDVVGVLPPMSHNAGWLYTVLPAIASHATMVSVGRGDPTAMLDRMERHGVSVAFMVPTHLRDLVSTYRAFPGRWQLRLRLVITGAAPAQEPIVRAAVEDWGITLVSMYGMTECQGLTFTRADDPVEVVATTVGAPCPGAWVALRDPSTGSVIDTDGVAGEVVARGPLIFLGYYEDEAATRQALTPDGWLLTGDLGQWAEGRLQIVGRRKEVIVRGGLTLTPEEIEFAFEQVPGVGEVVAVGLPDSRLGERTCLAVTGSVPTREALRDHLIARGRSTKLLPDEIRTLAFVPRTDLGKPMRARVRGLLLSAGPATDEEEHEA